MIMGFSGLVPFGNVVFFGIGAYITAIWLVNGLPFFAGILVSGTVCFLFTLAIGHPILKMKGHYFAVATFGISEAIKQITTNLSITGGGGGINLPVLNWANVNHVNWFFYYLMLVIVAVTVVVTFFISKGRLGYALRAYRANEDGAKSIGINTPLCLMIAWGLSALFMGLVGGVYGYWMTFIDPPSAFDVGIAVKFIIMVLVGGAGSIFGPVLGAFFIELISELAWSKFLNVHSTVLGIIIVFVIIFMPRGFTWFYRKGFTLDALLENVREGKL